MCQALKVGSLVHGYVRRLESFGAFIGIDGTSISALLHISNISSVHVNQIEVGVLRNGSPSFHDQATPLLNAYGWGLWMLTRVELHVSAELSSCYRQAVLALLHISNLSVHAATTSWWGPR